MTSEFAAELMPHLPTRCQFRHWVCLYHGATHGFSAATLLRYCQDRGPTVLVVMDTARHVFGAFVSRDWTIQTRYFGSGESFLFTLLPRKQVFHWTQTNSMFVIAHPHSIGFGGGGEGAGLFFDADLEHGASFPCETFGNPGPLAGSSHFTTVAVEVWGFAQ